ncbi:MAG: 1,4-dihydroxy-2-naphthoate octaprenyltransferase [Candidatus Lustribacter sp.]
MNVTRPAPRVWLLALRPFSFTASVVPAVYGGLLALALRGRDGIPDFRFDGVAFAVTILGCVAIHSASNLVNDFFDHRSGVDQPDNFGAVNVLVRKLMSPRQISIEAAGAFALAAGCGLYLVLQAGSAQWPLVALIVFGALSAYFYTAPPFAFKNRGFGDIQVMLSFALAMVFGAFYVQAHALSWLPVIDALPIGLLVVDILHINNLRDLATDRAAGITTIAIALGDAGAKRLHQTYVVGAFAVTAVLVAFSLLSPWTLIVFAAAPAALKLNRAVQALGAPDVDPMIVVKTARFHALFGALLILGLIIGISL